MASYFTEFEGKKYMAPCGEVMCFFLRGQDKVADESSYLKYTGMIFFICVQFVKKYSWTTDLQFSNAEDICARQWVINPD